MTSMKLALLCFVIFLSLTARSLRDRDGKWQTFRPFKRAGVSYPNTADLGSFSNNKHLKHIFGRQVLRFEPTKVQSHSKHHSKKCRVSFKHGVIFTCSSHPMPSSSTHIFCNFSPFAFHQCMKWSWSYSSIATQRFSKFPILDRLASSVRVLFRCLLLASSFRLPAFGFRLSDLGSRLSELGSAMHVFFIFHRLGSCEFLIQLTFIRVDLLGLNNFLSSSVHVLVGCLVFWLWALGFLPSAFDSRLSTVGFLPLGFRPTYVSLLPIWTRTS